jgi:hypothetical protein
VRLLAFAAALLALANCSESDRRFLLTYDHPQMRQIAQAQNATVPVAANSPDIVRATGTPLEPSDAQTRPTAKPQIGIQKSPAAAPVPSVAPTRSVPSHVARKTATPASVPSATRKGPQTTAGTPPSPAQQASPPREESAGMPAIAAPRPTAAPSPSAPAADANAAVSAAPSGPRSEPGDINSSPAPASAPAPSAPPAVAPANPAPKVPPPSAAAEAPAAPASVAASTPAEPPQVTAALGVRPDLPHVSPAAEAHCKSVAQQRKQDAEANGYEDDLQQQVFDGTYKNCMEWEEKHS